MNWLLINIIIVLQMNLISSFILKVIDKDMALDSNFILLLIINKNY